MIEKVHDSVNNRVVTGCGWGKESRMTSGSSGLGTWVDRIIFVQVMLNCLPQGTEHSVFIN